MRDRYGIDTVSILYRSCIDKQPGIVPKSAWYYLIQRPARDIAHELKYPICGTPGWPATQTAWSERARVSELRRFSATACFGRLNDKNVLVCTTTFLAWYHPGIILVSSWRPRGNRPSRAICLSFRDSCYLFKNLDETVWWK